MTPPALAFADSTDIVEFPPLAALDLPTSAYSLVSGKSPAPYYSSPDGEVALYHGDSVELLPKIQMPGAVDLLFADPPYFLSNGGTTCKNGVRAKVDKGTWDRLESVESMHQFNRRWLQMAQGLLAMGR